MLLHMGSGRSQELLSPPGPTAVMFPTMPRLMVILGFFLLTPGLAPGQSNEVSYQPYEKDDYTLHLWHLDEKGPPFLDSGSSQTPLQGLLNLAAPDVTSLSGLGTGISFHFNVGGTPRQSDLMGGILLAAPTLHNSPVDNVPNPFPHFGQSGAFTYEAILKLDVLPSAAGGIGLGLITMDGDSADRIFNFRIERDGFLAFIPLPHSGAAGGALATIPTSGPNAIDAQHWFHVAVSYDGNAGSPNNLRLYWTRLDGRPRVANLIGSGTLSNDLNGVLGDFAIGNEARAFDGNAEAEPFPGIIDEVRISAVARDPSDFFFVPAALRQSAISQNSPPTQATRSPLTLTGILVDNRAQFIPLKRELSLESGLHRLDFDFGYPVDRLQGPSTLRCQLEGVDERWQETARGMSLICQVLGAEDEMLSQTQFAALGRSLDWETSLEEAAMVQRREPIFIPQGAKALRLILSSGSPDTTGLFEIDNLSLTDASATPEQLWPNGDFSIGENFGSPAGVPNGWRRGGTDAAIARLITNQSAPALGLVDGDQNHHGEWTSQQALPEKLTGKTLVLSWMEAFNVIGGSTHRATYINVPPGNYVFRAIGASGDGNTSPDNIEIKLVIRPAIYEQPWFLPTAVGGIITLIATLAVIGLRQRARYKLERLQFQNALEQDRSRIARDMHDDLGTRVTVLNLTASLAKQTLDHDPSKTSRHLDKMTSSARELVEAMDDLVWAVDPANDTLDHLGAHLTRMAGEMFRDTPIRCRLDIPTMLPALPLHADIRHHLALAAKEALHNILKYAGPCDARLSLKWNGSHLKIIVEDHGIGFDPELAARGNGLNNLGSRMKKLGGTCEILSRPDEGTTITLECPLPSP
jgi:signal transduction histidine kinase